MGQRRAQEAGSEDVCRGNEGPPTRGRRGATLLRRRLRVALVGAREAVAQGGSRSLAQGVLQGMKFTSLGRCGLKVSRVCLGAFGFGDPGWQAWVLDEARSRPIIRRALELGINSFDTADYYSNGESEAVARRPLREFGRPAGSLVC